MQDPSIVEAPITDHVGSQVQYRCGCIIAVLYHCIIQHCQTMPCIIKTHELGWASTRSRPGPPFCSIRNNSIVKSLQRGIQSFANGCSNCALIADMKLNLTRTPSTRTRMVLVVALMNLIALTYPKASTTCMPRIYSRLRTWWTRVTTTNEVV